MIVYEVMADYDCTTRSKPHSEGLFRTRKAAEKAVYRIGAASWQSVTIHERQVYE